MTVLEALAILEAATLECKKRSASPFFRGHQDSVRDLLGKRMDALAREFHETHDLKIKEEIDRLAAELVKLDKPWVFVAR